MDHQTYLKLKNALIQQRREVSTSKEARNRLIDKSGLTDILVPIGTGKKRNQTKVTTQKPIEKQHTINHL